MAPLPSCTLQKRPSFPHQFGQEENMPGHSNLPGPPHGTDSLEDSLGHSFERKAHWFVWKAARVFPIPTQAE